MEYILYVMFLVMTNVGHPQCNQTFIYETMVVIEAINIIWPGGSAVQLNKHPHELMTSLIITTCAAAAIMCYGY